MSAENSRLTRAIQRIAEQSPDIRQAIEATKPRGDQASAAGVGTSDAERDRICCDGSTSDNANPGTSERDTSEGGQDGLDPNDPAKLSSGDGTLSGVTDCATGEPICFDGSGFIPPERWDDPQEPPVLEGWELGYYWSYGNQKEPTGRTALIAEWDRILADDPNLIGYSIDFFDEIDETSLRGSATFEHISGDPNDNVTSDITAGRFGCVDSDPESYCPDEPPREESWPEDGCTNLAIVGGSIVGSKYDPENDGSYSKPRSEIELCDDFGNSFYLRPSAGGGWKSISDLTTGPDGHLYDSTGMQIRRISHDEFTDSTV